MKPIIYKSTVPVRFSDLDPYGHVNSAHFLDYVISARWEFAREKLGVTDRSLVEWKIGFYLAKSQMNFKRPIAGAGNVIATSYVTEINEAKLTVPFDLKSADESVTYSDGVLEFYVIDLNTNRPTACPDWARRLFFEDAQA